MSQVDVIIVGAGPAGMVTACLLARNGLKVVIIEKNDNFEREFRGEILQPRFHKALMDAQLFEHVQKAPHEEVEGAHFYFSGKKRGEIRLKDLAPEVGVTWWMTQPNLLRALDEYGRQYSGYEIWFNTKVKSIDGETVIVEKEDQEVQLKTKVTIGSDGRFSTVRRLAGLDVRYDKHDFDVLWFAIPRPEKYHHVFSFFLSLKKNYLILPKHPDLLQCGLILNAGEFQKIQKKGIHILKKELRKAHPIFEEFADKLEKFSEFHPLKGGRALVRKWAKDRLMLIGDAAHTCSPAGGIGVSIAVETASVAAGVVLECFRKNNFSESALSEVQKVREREVKKVHSIQGRARLALLTPVFLRVLVPFIMTVANKLGLITTVARQLLVQQGRLPLYGLARGSLYSDQLTVKEGLSEFFKKGGFGPETYHENWVKLPVGPFHIYLPNVPPRKDVVPLHDVHHVINEYETNWTGEVTISGFELGCGLSRYWFGWIIDLQALWLGLFLFPKAFFEGFVRGRRSESIYKTYEYNDELLNKKLGEIRDRLRTAPKDGLKWKLSDVFALIGMALFSLLIHSPFVIVPYLIYLHI